MSPLSISAEHRNLLYERILFHLSDIEAVFLAASHHDYEAAQRLSERFIDELQLVIDDLGWGDHSGDEAVVLRTSPTVLQRVLERLRQEAAEMNAEIEAREAETQNRRVLVMCDALLGCLNGRLDAVAGGQ